MRKHSLDKLMNRLSLLLLLGTAVFLAAYWRRIPEEVPMHFNAAGEIDRWGSKWWLLMLPVITWLVYGFLTVAEQIFGICGNGAKGPEKNRGQAFILLGHLLSTQKLLFTALFTWITLWCALAQPLPAWFSPATLAVVFGDMTYWIVRLIRNK